MPLAELRIENVRCISGAALEFAPTLNLIAGENGAGKTSVLEAIFLLGRGRSFRTRITERLIKHGERSLTVFGRTDDEPARTAGIEVRPSDGSRARIDGRDAQSLLELSDVLAIQAIDPEIHKLIDQGPERRRRWLDWMVFHVEPRFMDHWTRYQRALKQRNAALKSESANFEAWDAQLVEHGEAITGARRTTLDRLRPQLDGLFRAFGGLNVTSAFFAGWAQEQTLAAALLASSDRDRQRGSTMVGPHRADVLLRKGNRSARETLSRGQQKLTGVAMIVAQLRLLAEGAGKRSVLLLDDPAAELDSQNLHRLFVELGALDCQMIATSLRADTPLFRAPDATFHVEHGRVLRL